MEASEEILVRSLVRAGVDIPVDVSSIHQLTPPLLLSISVQSLRLIDSTAAPVSPLPLSDSDHLPSSSPAGRFRICSQLARAVTNLGYVGDMSFDKFLYPSEEDLYKLVRFFVKKLSECPENKDYIINPGTPEKEETTCEVPIDKSHDQRLDSNFENIISDGLNDLNLKTEALVMPSHLKPANAHLEITDKTENLKFEEKFLLEEGAVKGLEFQKLEEEHEMSKAAVEMAFDKLHSVDFYIDQLARQVDEKKNNLTEQRSKWVASIKSLEDKKRSLEESLCASANSQVTNEKLLKFKEAKLETQSVLSQTSKREEEVAKLLADLEKQRKQAPRRSYIQRISEITKNSRKQDADIERILKETRELQLGSNSVYESLHRTYGVVDETVYREAKKDAVGRQAYRLLTSIHQTFEQISEKILTIDRARREAAEHEAKLAVMASRSFNADKLLGDLEAIRKENELLEHRQEDT